MALTVERLRTWIAGLAALLVLSLLAFFAYARWQVRHLGRDLPARLGVQIQQSTNGFTFSKSQGGHTLFTLHAAKAVQFRSGGHTHLHDVSIILYGPDGRRADRIAGSDFDYDPASGIARADGEVTIDLQAPTADASAPTEDGENRNTVHIRTAGLVFNQKTGEAQTAEKLEFRLADAAGSAVGASYDSHAGTLVLDTAVSFRSSANGSPLAMRAHHGEFNRARRELKLVEDSIESGDTEGTSHRATVFFRADGSAERVDAGGDVHLKADGGQEVRSQQARILLNTDSRPTQALLDGGLSLVSNDPARTIQASSRSGTLWLNAESAVNRVQLRDAVRVDEGQASGADRDQAPGKGTENPKASSRRLTAQQVDVLFGAGPNRHPQPQRVLVTGSQGAPAQFQMETVAAPGPAQQTAIQGDQIVATLRDGSAVSAVSARGHTQLVQVSNKGVRQSSTADTLDLTFAPAQPGHRSSANDPAAASVLESAVQEGHVVLTEIRPAGSTAQKSATSSPGRAQTQTTAFADKATYHAADQTMRLEGSPRLQDATGELTASEIDFSRATGAGKALGGVKATYRQAPDASGKTGPQTGGLLSGPEPVHIVADRALLSEEGGRTIFVGTDRAPARLWQGSDAITAPEIDLSQSLHTLTARGSGASPQVHAVFNSATAGRPAASKNPGSPSPGAVTPAPPAVVRVESRSLVYSDAQHQMTLRGGVTVQQASGVIHAAKMDIYLRDPQSSAAGQGSQVEKIVAEGGVTLEQPGRSGSGDKLVYIAAQDNFVLTGTPSAPPRLADQVHGTVTGNSLIFNNRDDSVLVSGGTQSAVTQTRVTK